MRCDGKSWIQGPFSGGKWRRGRGGPRRAGGGVPPKLLSSLLRPLRTGIDPSTTPDASIRHQSDPWLPLRCEQAWSRGAFVYCSSPP